MALLMFLALLPSVALMVYIYRKDKIEKEPLPLLVSLFLLGALTIISAIAIGGLGEAFLSDAFDPESVAWLAIDNFLLTALVEEGGKYLVMKLRTWRSPEFNYLFDGIVYAVTASLGFATVENVLYLLDSDLTTAIMRAIMSVPGHAMYGMFMGYFYGRAKRFDVTGNRGACKKNLFLALWVPVLLHGFYDFCLCSGNETLFVVVLAFQLVLTIWAFRTVRKASREDAPIL